MVVLSAGAASVAAASTETDPIFQNIARVEALYDAISTTSKAWTAAGEPEGEFQDAMDDAIHRHWNTLEATIGTPPSTLQGLCGLLALVQSPAGFRWHAMTDEQMDSLLRSINTCALRVVSGAGRTS
jgi:hypothetical protein